jgi:hypothetical protein
MDAKKIKHENQSNNYVEEDKQLRDDQNNNQYNMEEIEETGTVDLVKTINIYIETNMLTILIKIKS